MYDNEHIGLIPMGERGGGRGYLSSFGEKCLLWLVGDYPKGGYTDDLLAGMMSVSRGCCVSWKREAEGAALLWG